MNILIKDVLELSEFKGSMLIAGESGINNEVGNVTLMEVPDIFPYLEEKSLLLTTLYPIHKDEKAILELIPRLAEKNIAGIGIKPERYVDEISQNMIRQAEALNIPLIKLAPEANLSKLANKVLTISLNKHITVLDFRNNVHQRMMENFLNGEGLETLVNALSQIIGYSVILFDNLLNVICASKELELDSCKYAISGNFNPKDDVLYSNTLIEKEVTIQRGEVIEKETFHIYPIKAGGDYFAYIALLKVKDKDENLLAAIEQAALVMASVFQRNRALQEKERNFLDSFAREILQGNINSQMEAIQRAKAFGWMLEFPQTIVVIKVFDVNERQKKDIYDELLRTGFIEKVLSSNLMKKVENIKVIYLEDSLVVFVNVLFANSIQQNLAKAAEVIIKKFSTTFKIGVGISNIVENNSKFPSAYLEAIESVKVGGILNKNSFISNYDDLRTFKIIKEVTNIEVLKDYVNRVLGKVIQYERESEMNMLETLEVLIENNFNLQKTSSKMFIHYNTLRYRVDKLKQLGINIESGFDMGELSLAYQTYIWLKANNNI